MPTSYKKKGAKTNAKTKKPAKGTGVDQDPPIIIKPGGNRRITPRPGLILKVQNPDSTTRRTFGNPVASRDDFDYTHSETRFTLKAVRLVQVSTNTTVATWNPVSWDDFVVHIEYKR